MVEIPVKHKDRDGFPLWWAPLGLLGLLGGGLFFSRACNGPSATAMRDAERAPVVADDRSAEQAAAQGAAAQAAAQGVGCVSDQDCGSEQLCSGGSCMALSAAGLCGEARVHFATDSAAIPATDHGQLDRLARCIRADQRTKLFIEGNADERGTDDHNAQLAERRAMAVARELASRGVSPEQLRIVSYGENNPLCAEQDSDCWARNRRAAVRPETP